MRSSEYWLLLDVGNTHTVAGVVAASPRSVPYPGAFRAIATARFRTDPEETPDEYRAILRDLLSERWSRAIVSSVVPALDATLQDALAPAPVHFVRHDSPCEFTLALPSPTQLGADRLANLAGAIRHASRSGMERQPLLIIDAGTATTFCLLDRDRVYRGGAIVPGFEVSWDALRRRAAKLSAVDLTRPARALGVTTETQIQSGVLIGYEAMVEGLSARLLADWGNPEEVRILTTGGCMNRLRLPSRFEQVADLTLIGLERYGQLTAD